ncbi:hypothetical protein PIB30_108389, partial [Stylosanthes scabra]|nr:hypothetical protein [Stylosanthes scabra]
PFSPFVAVPSSAPLVFCVAVFLRVVCLHAGLNVLRPLSSSVAFFPEPPAARHHPVPTLPPPPPPYLSAAGGAVQSHRDGRSSSLSPFLVRVCSICMADSDEVAKSAENQQTEQVCSFFRKPNNRKNIRKRAIGSDDGAMIQKMKTLCYILRRRL